MRSDDPRSRQGAFFGRRQGHKLRPRQAQLLDTLLPQIALDLQQPAADLRGLFACPVEAVRLEIGFGGGAFSGKDPTKVDRSAAYAARYLAKNVVAAGLAERCTIQIAYAIGVADPMSLLVDTHGTGKVDESKLQKALPEIFPLRPTNIRRALKLSRPIYRRTAAYGHFGRAPEKDGGFSWERLDLADALRRAFK